IRARGLAQGVPSRALDALLDALLRGALPPGSEALAPLLQPGVETFLDFLPPARLVVLCQPDRGAPRRPQPGVDTSLASLPPASLVVLDEPDAGRERLARFQVEALEGFAGANTGERVVCEPDELLLGADALAAAIEERR